MSSSISISNHGSGPQNVATGSGGQQYNNAGGRQYIYNDNYDTGTHVPMTQANEIEQPGQHDRQPTRRHDFRVAIICALPLEYDAVTLLFDKFWDDESEQYGRAPGDVNTYSTGRIGKYDVVLALLPNMGTATAAGATAGMRSSYPNLELALLVGVCGGVPDAGSENEKLLGDVVISETVQHGLGAQYPAAFIAKDTAKDGLGRPNRNIRSLIASFGTELGRQRLHQKACAYLKDLQKKAIHQRRRCSYQYPGVAEDQLFEATYQHKHREAPLCTLCLSEPASFCREATQLSCAQLKCDTARLVPRTRLAMKEGMEPDEAQSPEIFVGRIASGDTVMKSGEHRDRIASQQGVIALEMEGSGVWDEVPCIIIKGICDYADSHKNKKWQPFAAATAAAVTKAVLGRYTRADKQP